MLLIDDLLGLPFSGFGFVLRTLQRVAEEQYMDDALIKEQLLELQLRLESGEITEEQYEQKEAAIIRQLHEIENRRHELADAPSVERDRGITFSTGQTKANTSVTFHQDTERKP